MPEGNTEGLLLQSQHLFKINTTPNIAEAGTMARLAAGLNNFAVSGNEELDQTHYLDGDGFGSTDIMGAQLVITFSGHRKFGDPAQDFVFSLLMELGENRKTDFEWTLPSGEKFAGPCTIANIEGPGGDANNKGDISFEIHFNGKPEYTPGTTEG